MNSFSTYLLFAAAAVATVAGHHVPGHLTTQYHTQDEFGQYAYGYSGGPSSKHEQRTADGVTQGGYSYVDANGVVQSASYVSDPVNGFRVSATNLPVAPAAYPAVPVVHQAVPVPAPVYDWSPAAPVYGVPSAVPAAVPALPSVVDARHLAVGPAYVAHPQLLKVSKPLTPAGTSNVHYPEHVLLSGRKKRSAGLYPYPLASGYSAPPAAHVVTVKHAEYSAPPAPVTYVAAAPPAATSYTSVVRHLPASAPAVHYAPAPKYSYVSAPAPVVYAAAPAPVAYAPAPAPVAYAPAPAPVAYAAAPAPVAYAPAPVAYAAVPAPVAVAHAVKTQFHEQDEHGQYTYGYTDGASAKTETRYADGETKGSYSYVDDHGAVQAVHYSAGADGFKAAGTNIPVHHV